MLEHLTASESERRRRGDSQTTPNTSCVYLRRLPFARWRGRP